MQLKISSIICTSAFKNAPDKLLGAIANISTNYFYRKELKNQLTLLFKKSS
jgi:hypothetical protein